MLSSLLPGFRHLRAPLAAGVLLLVGAVSVLLGSGVRLSIDNSDSEVLNAIEGVISPGMTIGLAVATYLIGAIAVKTITITTNRLTRHFLGKAWYKRYVEGEPTAWMRVISPFTRTSLVRLNQRCGGDEELAESVRTSILFSGGERLLLANKDLYLEWDRRMSEMEFRYAISVPGILITVPIVLSFPWSAWVKAAVMATSFLIFVALLVHGRLIEREAHSLHAHAVTDRVVSTRALDLGQPSQDDQDRLDHLLRDFSVHEQPSVWLHPTLGEFDPLRWSNGRMRELHRLGLYWGQEKFTDPVIDADRTALVQACAGLYEWAGSEGGVSRELGGELHTDLKRPDHRPGKEVEYQRAEEAGNRFANEVLLRRRRLENTARNRGFRIVLHSNVEARRGSAPV